MIAFSQDYGDVGAAAWVYCPTDAPQGVNSEGDRWCRGQELHFNLNPRYAVFFEDDGSRDHVACHELGHTIGLRHWGNPPVSVGPSAATCMNADTPDGPPNLHQIDIDHINAYRYVAPPPSRRIKLVGVPAGPRWPRHRRRRGVDALEVERYASLREMAARPDVVVRGTVDVRSTGPHVRGFGRRARCTTPPSRSGSSEVVAGRVNDRDAVELTLEIPLFDGIDSIGSIASSLVGSEGVFLLRNKGESARAAGLSVAEQRRTMPTTACVVIRRRCRERRRRRPSAGGR